MSAATKPTGHRFVHLSLVAMVEKRFRIVIPLRGEMTNFSLSALTMRNPLRISSRAHQLVNAPHSRGVRASNCIAIRPDTVRGLGEELRTLVGSGAVIFVVYFEMTWMMIMGRAVREASR